MSSKAVDDLENGLVLQRLELKQCVLLSTWQCTYSLWNGCMDRVQQTRSNYIQNLLLFNTFDVQNIPTKANNRYVNYSFQFQISLCLTVWQFWLGEGHVIPLLKALSLDFACQPRQNICILRLSFLWKYNSAPFIWKSVEFPFLSIINHWWCQPLNKRIKYKIG